MPDKSPLQEAYEAHRRAWAAANGRPYQDAKAWCRVGPTDDNGTRVADERSPGLPTRDVI